MKKRTVKKRTKYKKEEKLNRNKEQLLNEKLNNKYSMIPYIKN